uniref:PspC domain-containing protein n=1 Tax=Nocardiopsis trehalosi TaxID=109329 RepID=UPI000835C059
MDGAARPEAAAPTPGGAASAGAERERGLSRLNDRGVVTGVCAGLGAYTRIDPVVWRAAFAVTALAGFTGVWLYVAAWAMMRDASGGPAMLEQLLNRRIAQRAVPALLGAGLAVAGALSLAGGFSWGTLVLATPLILGLLVAHNRGVNLQRTYRDLPGMLKSKEPPPAAPAPEPRPAYYNPAQPWAQAPSGPIDLKVVADRARAAAPPGAGADDDEEAPGGGRHPLLDPHQLLGGLGGHAGVDPHRLLGGVGGQAVADPLGAGAARRRARRAERRRRRGIRLFAVATWAFLAITGIALAVGEPSSPAGLLGDAIGPVYLGSVVVVIGAALVLGTWVGDPRGLIAAGAVVTLVLVATVSLDVPGMRFAVEEWRPATVAEAERPYTLTGGAAELDLTGLAAEPGQRVNVSADVRFGTIEVLVPATARVVVRGRASIGEITIDDAVRAGTRLDVRRTLEPEPGEGAGGRAGEERTGAAGDDPVTLVVDLRSYGADMEVRRVTA